MVNNSEDTLPKAVLIQQTSFFDVKKEAVTTTQSPNKKAFKPDESFMSKNLKINGRK